MSQEQRRSLALSGQNDPRTKSASHHSNNTTLKNLKHNFCHKGKTDKKKTQYYCYILKTKPREKLFVGSQYKLIQQREGKIFININEC